MPFYDALLKLDEIAEIRGEDRAKLKNFRAFFFELLEQKEKWTVSECLELILERTKYDRYVLGLPQGKRHFANLRKLLEIAREVEGREPIHLGDFIRYVKGLELQEVRESEAQVEALEGNVVKLMTIHKAKGLEFKVVLIPDLNRKGEKRRAPFLLDSEYGLGFKVFNETNRKFEETLAYKKAKEKMVRDALEESKRLLYVGMTRAKDLLILSGSSEESGEEGEEGRDAVDEQHVLEGLVTPVHGAEEEGDGAFRPQRQHADVQGGRRGGDVRAAGSDPPLPALLCAPAGGKRRPRRGEIPHRHRPVRQGHVRDLRALHQ